MLLDFMTLGVSWAPDGRSLVYSKMNPGLNTADIWRMRPNGTHGRKLTQTPNKDEWMPAPSPNGRSIAYIEDFTKIVRANLNTGKRAVNVHEPGNMGMPAWRPLPFPE